MSDLLHLTDKIKGRAEFVMRKLADYGYPAFFIEINFGRLKPGCAGIAIPSQNKITISHDYLREFPDSVIGDTIPHEICHLYQKRYMPYAKQHHGPEFRRLMNILGLSGETYHSMKLENGPVRKTRLKIRYVYLTETTKKECLLTSQQHNKMQNNLADFRHKMTGEKIYYSGQQRTYQ